MTTAEVLPPPDAKLAETFVPEFRHSDAFILMLIGLTFALTAMSVDTMVSSLPYIAADLQITDTQVQITLTALMAAMGIGQMYFGPLSDSKGRRYAMLQGLGIYLLSSAVCLFAPNITILAIGRFGQGLGVAAAMALGRSILRDLYHAERLSSMFSLCFAAIALVPMISVVIGHYAAALISWRATIGVHIIYALILLAIYIFSFKETIKLRNPTAMQPRILWNCVLTVIKHPQSRLFIIVQTLINLAMFGYVVSSQLLFATAFEITGVWFSILYGVIGLGTLPGPILNNYLVTRIGTVASMLFFHVLNLAVAIIGVLVTMAGLMDAVIFSALLFVFIMTVMANVANSSSLVMDPMGKIAGLASSLLGTVTFGIGAVGGGVFAAFLGDDPQQLFVGFLFVTIVVFLLTLWWHLTNPPPKK